MKPYAVVDTSQTPIVSVRFTGEKGSDENFKKYLEDLEHIYVDRKFLAIIFDATEASIPKLSLQKKQALWISIHWKMIQTYCKGTAYVIPSMPVRAVLKMIFSFQNQPVPYKIFSTVEQAENWIKEIMDTEEKASK